MIEKIKTFLNTHESIKQIIKFTLFSCIAFLVEFSAFYGLQYGLRSSLGNVEFRWFLFDYPAGNTGSYGVAGFIAFLVSKCIAEIISFTINRKKTFEANNNIVYSAIMYVITVIAIILLSTWLGGALGGAIGPKIGADAGNTIGKLLGSVLSWVIMFIMDKFVIMRKSSEKTAPEAAQAVLDEAEEIPQAVEEE